MCAAIEQLDAIIQNNSAKTDYAFYLRGNAYSKAGDWRLAIDNYSRAIEINPQSPAVEARRAVMDILEFYNKEMFNH